MLTIPALVMMSAVFASDEPSPSPLWNEDYGKALKQTQAEQRPLLIVMDVPSDPKLRVEPALLSVEKEETPLESYELCHVDVSTEYGKRVAEVFRVDSFPHVAIIDKTGSVILDRIEGKIDSEKWSSTLLKHRTGARRSDRRFQVSKPVLGGSFSLPEAITPSKPFCPACQRKSQGL